MSNEIVDAEFINAQDEAEYQLLLDRLDQEFPPVSRRGFDLSKIRGNIAGRTGKAIVLQLTLTGTSVAEIAETLDLSPRVVSRLLGEALREAAPLDDIELIRTHELMKLDAQARVCHEQFKRSCEDEVAITTEKKWVEGEEEPVEETVVKTVRKGQSGNPGYQKVLLEIAKHRDKLLGLAKPAKVEIDKTEKKLVVNQIVVKTREDVERVRQQEQIGQG